MVHCFSCGEPIRGGAIRIQLGYVVYLKRGTTFIVDSFGDNSYVKWLHANDDCSNGCEPSLLDENFCAICGEQFFGEDREECALHIEEGEVNPDFREPAFNGTAGGAVHEVCAEGCWELNLWRE